MNLVFNDPYLMCSCYKVSVSRVTAGGSRGFRLNVSIYVFISSSDKHDLHFSTRFDSVLRWTHSSVILKQTWRAADVLQSVILLHPRCVLTVE